MDSENESRRLRAIAAETRLKTIKTELSLAFTWCTVARTEHDLGESERFSQSLAKIRRAADSLRQRIFEPLHIPLELRPEFEAELKDLEAKIKQLEDSRPTPTQL